MSIRQVLQHLLVKKLSYIIETLIEALSLFTFMNLALCSDVSYFTETVLFCLQWQALVILYSLQAFIIFVYFSFWMPHQLMEENWESLQKHEKMMK